MEAPQSQLQIPKIPRKKYRTKFYDIKDGYKLVAFINKIPNLEQIKFRLSEQECQIVGENENLIVIGRSGSGKTTCALMRLFSIQILHTNLNAHHRHLEEQRSGKYQCTPDLIDEKFGIRNIFLTASAFLITSIQSKYDQLVLHVKKELSKKLELKGIQIGDSRQKKQGEKPSDNNRKNNQRDEKFNTFHSLEDNDFPGFFTIREFLIMMDGSLVNHFFVRDKTGKRIQNLKAIYAGNQDKQYQIRLKDQLCYAKECKWQQFQQKFWSKNINSIKQVIKQKHNYSSKTEGKLRQITSIIVWTQIFSTIKGEFQSHTYPDRYLPLKRYLELSKNKTYKIYQKQAIYQIFLMYQAWKTSQINKYYDLLDLTNHLMVYIRQFYDYMNMNHLFIDGQPPQFHYLFLDQVQDLPPSVPYLISMVFSDGVYFSGDSAQAIQKGVSFKFGDLKYMFNEHLPLPPLNFENPKQHKLTVNFRSHQNILNFANIITQILIKIFPKSIDPLKQQQSQIRGPKPILLGYGHQQTIKALLQRKEGKIHEQCQTAIIIRSHEIQLSKGMKDLDYLVLTVEQSKGMEFRDVVMYGFFQSKRQYLWKILKYLDIFPQRGLKQFRKQDFDLEDYLQLITELKLLYTLVTRTKCSLLLCQNIPIQLEAILHNKDVIYNFRDVGLMLADIEKYRSQMVSLAFISWEDRGHQFQINQQYKLALKCYRKSTNYKKCIQMQAIILHRRSMNATQSLKDRYNINFIQAQLTQQQLKDNPSFKNYKKALSANVWPQQQEAGQKYKQIEFYTQAGDCFILVEDFQQALLNYQKVKQDKKVYFKLAVCFENIKDEKKNNLRQAAKYYGLSKSYHEMLEILDQLKDYGQLINQIKQNNDIPDKQYYYRNAAKRIITKEFESIDKIVNKQQKKLQTKRYHFSQSELVFTQMNLFNFQAQLENSKAIFSFIQKILECLQKIQTQISWEQKNLAKINSRFQQFQSSQEKKQSRINDLKKQIKNIEQRILNTIYLSSKQKYAFQIFKKQIEIQQSIIQFGQIRKKNIKQFLISFHSSWEYKGILQKLQYLNTLLRQTLYSYDNIDSQAELLLSQLIVFPCIRGNKIKIKNRINHASKIVFQRIAIKNKTLQEILQKFKVYKQNQSKRGATILQSHQKDYFVLIQWLLNYNAFKQNLKIQLIECKSAYHRQFSSLLEEEKQRFKVKVLQEIYSKADPSNCQHIFLINQYFSQRASKEITLFQKGADKYLNIDLHLFHNNPNHQQGQIKDILQLLSFQQISNLSLYSSRQINKNLIDFIPKMETICPRAVMGFASSLQARYKSVDYLLAQLTSISSIYQNKNAFNNFEMLPKLPQTKKQEKSKRILQIINLEYFQFQIQRTKLRKEIASNEFVQGLVLLGIQKDCRDMLDEVLLFRLDMNEMNYSKYIIKENNEKNNKNNGKIAIEKKQNNSKSSLQIFQLDSNSEQVWQMRSRLLIDQFIKMDSQEKNSWYNSNRHNRNYYNLMNKECQQKIDKFIDEDISHKRHLLKTQRQSLIHQIKLQIQDSSKLYNSKRNFYYLDSFLPIFDAKLDGLNTQQLIIMFCNLARLHQSIYQNIRKIILADLEYDIQILETYTMNIVDFLGFVKQAIVNSNQKLSTEQIQKFKIFTKAVFNMKFQLIQLTSKGINSYCSQWQKMIQNLLQQVKKHQHIQALRKQITNKNTLANLINKLQDNNFHGEFMRQSQQLDSLKKKQKKILRKWKQKQLYFQDEQRFIDDLQKSKHKNQYYKHKIRAEYYYSLLNSAPQNLLYRKSINILQLIFCKQSSQCLHEYLKEIFQCSQTSKSLEEKFYYQIQLILSCFSLANYQRDKRYRHNTNLIKSSQLIFVKMFESLQNPHLDEESFSLYCSFLYIFKAKVIRNSMQMNIFSYFVLLNQSSPLLQSTTFKENSGFCHYINNDRQVVLMRLENVSKLVTQRICKDPVGRAFNPPIITGQTIFSNLLLFYENQDKTTKIRNIIQNIMKSREQLLDFYYNTSFVGSQSFLFVYHQLKNYYDLIQMIKLVKPPVSQNFESFIKTSLQILNKQFRDWKIYAKQLQILKKRVKFV